MAGSEPAPCVPHLSRLAGATAWPRLRGMTTYPLSDEDRAIQQRARSFVDDELIPWEEHAEANGGRIPNGERTKHHERAIELGLFAMNMPTQLGGTGMTTLQQVLVSEQIGRVTNALGLVRAHPARMGARGRERAPDAKPGSCPRSAASCTSATRSPRPGPGSDVDAIEATARRDGDEYVLTARRCT